MNTVENNQWGVLASKIFTNGDYYDLLCTDGGVSKSKSTGFLKNEWKRNI